MTVQQLSSTSGGVALAAQPDALKKAAHQFEAVFMRQMISSMRQASLGDELLGSSASDQFRDMGDAKLADDMANGKGLGIAEQLIKQLSKLVPGAGAVAGVVAKAADGVADAARSAAQ